MHYASGGKASGELDLMPYLGPCRVIHCIDCGPLVLPEHIGHALADLPPRVLLRTARTAFEIDACRYIARSRHLAETARHLNKTP